MQAPWVTNRRIFLDKTMIARTFAFFVWTLLLGVTPLRADDQPSWDSVLAEADGQTVYFNAWGGDETINGYVAWVGEQVSERFGVTLQHVKLADTAEAVARVLAEKTAGRSEGGTIDLIWINGENFASMKEQDLLFGPFVEDLPNFAMWMSRVSRPRCSTSPSRPMVSRRPGAWPSSFSSTIPSACLTRRARSTRCFLGEGQSRSFSPTQRRPISSDRHF